MSNNILVITSNPEKDSMTDAVGAAFAAGAVERGASADVLDLYDEGFNPVYSAADRAHYLGHAPMPEDVVPIQRRLAQADVIALVFPIYWYTMPAMVKGLFDRVICRGFAYHPPPAIFLYGQRANGAVFDNWFAQHIGRLSMTTSCACISRTCACESHRGSSGTIYRPPARSAVMAYGRHARLAPS